jgi:adenylate cyclase
MNLRDRPTVIWLLPLLVVISALLILGSNAGQTAARLREAAFDAYQRVQPRPYEDTLSHSGFAVRVLDSDAASLARFGPWPWPHATLARLSRELKTKGAAMVVFAFPLDVPDPLSPSNLAAQVPPGPQADAARAALNAMPSPDNDLTVAMSQLATMSGFTLGAVNAARAPLPKGQVAFVGDKYPFGRVPAFSNGAGAVAAIEFTSLGTGALNLTFDEDGKLRRMPMVFRLNGKPVPSLTAEMLRLIEHKQRFVVRSDEGGSGFLGSTPGIASFEALNRDLPTAPDGSMRIAFSGKRAERNLSAAALDENKVSAAQLANSIVILAPPGEIIATPDGMRSIADVYAEALENTLTATPLRRPASSIEIELICLAVFGIAGIIVFTRYGIIWSGAYTAVSIGAATAISWRFYSANHVLIDALGPSLALLCIFAACVLARGLEVSRSRARVRAAFAESLPAHVIEQIAHKPELLTLDGVRRTVTFMACGVRSYAALADLFKDNPSAFTRLMRRVLVPMMDAVLVHGGTIDRMTVDGFSAFWNAPLDDADHAIHACEAANMVSDAIARINEALAHERRNDGLALNPVEIGVGISTGPVIAGGFGAHGRTAYSVNGDCVVVAARIQQLSAQYGPAIIVGEDTRKAAESGFAFLEVDYISAGAHEEPLKLHALLGSPAMRTSPKFRALLTFHDHIFQSLRKQQWKKARELIEQCRKLSGASQKLYDLHLARIAHFEANPPGSDWDGAFRLMQK